MNSDPLNEALPDLPECPVCREAVNRLAEMAPGFDVDDDESYEKVRAIVKEAYRHGKGHADKMLNAFCHSQQDG